MNKEIVVMVLLVGVLLISIVQGIEINDMKIKLAAANEASSSSQGLSAYDQMMQEHHGGGADSTQASGIPSQVGGC